MYQSAKTKIVTAKKSDLSAILNIIKNVFEQYGMIYDPENDFPDLIAFDDYYPSDQKELYVIKSGQVIAGCGGYKFDSDGIPYLTRIYVDPKLQGQKLGEMLVRFLIEQAISESDLVYLWTDTRFKKAHKLYSKLGFTTKWQTRPLGDINESYEFYYELKREDYVSLLYSQS